MGDETVSQTPRVYPCIVSYGNRSDVTDISSKTCECIINEVLREDRGSVRPPLSTDTEPNHQQMKYRHLDAFYNVLSPAYGGRSLKSRRSYQSVHGIATYVAVSGSGKTFTLPLTDSSNNSRSTFPDQSLWGKISAVQTQEQTASYKPGCRVWEKDPSRFVR
jgi:hypothetical protein